MTTLPEKRLVSPCVNTNQVVCPRQHYPDCMKTCMPMQAFKQGLVTENCYMSSSANETGADYTLIWTKDGVACR